MKPLIFLESAQIPYSNLTKEFLGIQEFQTSRPSKIMIKWSNRFKFSSPQNSMSILLGNETSLVAKSVKQKVAKGYI